MRATLFPGTTTASYDCSNYLSVKLWRWIPSLSPRILREWCKTAEVSSVVLLGASIMHRSKYWCSWGLLPLLSEQGSNCNEIVLRKSSIITVDTIQLLLDHNRIAPFPHPLAHFCLIVHNLSYRRHP